MQDLPKTEDEWKKKLTPEQYRVLREKGTEAPFSGKYVNHNENGIYTCGACGAELFSSATKYESTMPGLVGWPAFNEVAKSDAVELRSDDSFGMRRTEVICKRCGGHLGHLFDEPPPPKGSGGSSDTKWTGKHYCINSCALGFEAKKTA
jgi:peptide-methionine (R)-S-oxide reductase